MYKLSDLLNEFAKEVNSGRLKKIPYHDWRLLKKHEDEYVRVERDGWGGLNLNYVNNNEIVTDVYEHDDSSFGTFLDDVYVRGLIKHNNTSALNLNANDIVVDRKENNNMNLFKNVDFGSCENDNVKMSIYGIAVKNAANTWVSYDSKSGNVVDVDILNFSAKYLYKMPVAIKDIAVGDTVIHCRKPMFVTKIEDGKLLVIDPAAAEEKIVLPVKSPFGFDVYTKIVNLFGNLAAGASADSPFGNMLPLMLLADGDKTDDMLPLVFAMSGGKFDMSNPMMLYFLMSNNKANDNMLPLLFAMNNNCFSIPAPSAE